MASFLIKGAEFNQSVAHHIRIGRKTGPYFLHRITGDLIPIFTMTVNHFEIAAILMGDSRRHLQILLRRAVPFLLFLRTYLDIETIGVESEFGELIDHDTAVNAS